MKYKFKEPLVEGIIKSRPNRFIMNVKVEGREVKCHCPSTGRIGSIVFRDIPCLLSRSSDKNRKTEFSVEAFSLDSLHKKEKSWIGINQTRANEYVEFFIKNGLLPEMTGKISEIKREVSFLSSRFDFFINGKDYLEVKTLLKEIPCEGHPNYKENKSKFTSFERIIKHFRDISENLGKNSSAIFLLCFIYDALPFEVPEPEKAEKKIVDAARKAALKGVENWQINLKIDKEGVELIKCFRLNLFNNV